MTARSIAVIALWGVGLALLYWGYLDLWQWTADPWDFRARNR